MNLVANHQRMGEIMQEIKALAIVYGVDFKHSNYLDNYEFMNRLTPLMREYMLLHLKNQQSVEKLLSEIE